MTDLHTHILPGMDDGARSVEEALKMLQTQIQQGVDTVALTPHYYGREESIKSFLARREAAYRKLARAAEGKPHPEMVLGAEVTWMPDMVEWQEIEKLCYQKTRVLLVELPMTPWTDVTFQQLYGLEGRWGLLPMIAHLDRYLHNQGENNIQRLLDTGYPFQISTEVLAHPFRNWRAMNLLKYGDAILISDCHNMDDRRPNLGSAVALVSKKLGSRVADQLAAISEEILIY